MIDDLMAVVSFHFNTCGPTQCDFGDFPIKCEVCFPYPQI